MNKQKIVTPSGIGLTADLGVGQLSWLDKLCLSSHKTLPLLTLQRCEGFEDKLVSRLWPGHTSQLWGFDLVLISAWDRP